MDPVFKARADLLWNIRRFFRNKNYLETDTPLLSPHIIPESTIDTFIAEWIEPYECRKKDLYLLPSPEIWMKKLLANGSGNIFQICKAFRNGEQKGPCHNPEFTILEWYSVDFRAEDNIAILEDLFRELLPQNASENISPPFRRMSMDEAFRLYAGFPLSENSDFESLKYRVLELGMSPAPEDTRESLFNRIFVNNVEDKLPQDKPLILHGYPSFIPTTARSIPGTEIAERWELYCRGIEIANCYTEERDEKALKSLFEKEIQRKKQKGIAIDETFCRQISEGLPPCSGVALGVDRLAMIILQKKTLQDVVYYPL